MEEQTPLLCTKCKRNPRKPNYFRCANCINEQYRAWASKNRDRIRASRRKAKEQNPDYYKTYYHDNREALLDYQREYLSDKPHAKIAYALNRKAKKFNKTDALKPSDVLDLYTHQPVCIDCGEANDSNLTVAYAFPLVYAPSTNTRGNLIRLCKACSKSQGLKLHKSIKTPELVQQYQFTDDAPDS